MRESGAMYLWYDRFVGIRTRFSADEQPVVVVWIFRKLLEFFLQM